MDARYPGPFDYPVHGIDVSKYQGKIDWQAAASSGVRFAWIKATEGGDNDDQMFAVNWNGARAAGIPTGAYHFYYFCRPVEDQIAWFKAHVPPTRGALPPVLDMEWVPTSKTCRIKPPREKILADMRRFLEATEAFYGKRPIIYTTVDFHRDILPGEMSEYPFWIRSVSGFPSTKYGDRRWTFWQYTATGRVPGVPANVDRNAFAGSEKDWDSFLASNAQTGADSTGFASAVPAAIPATAPAPLPPATAYASNEPASASMPAAVNPVAVDPLAADPATLEPVAETTPAAQPIAVTPPVMAGVDGGGVPLPPVDGRSSVPLTFRATGLSPPRPVAIASPQFSAIY